jgi:hypothetical protein
MILNKLYKLLYVLPLIVGINSCITENEDKITAIIKTNRIYPSLIPAVSDSEFAIVKSLFDKNKLSLSNLKVYRLLENQSRYHVRCYQYYNTGSFRNSLLEYFRNDVVFNFDKNNNYSSLGGDLINKIEIDIVPKAPMEEASNLFYDEINSDSWQKDSLESYYQEGFNAELGIYDLNAGLSYAEHNFVLSWRVTISNNLSYPQAYVRADSLKLIYYSNGIIIN